jgi:hypothetical protein
LLCTSATSVSSFAEGIPSGKVSGSKLGKKRKGISQVKKDGIPDVAKDFLKNLSFAAWLRKGMLSFWFLL